MSPEYQLQTIARVTARMGASPNGSRLHFEDGVPVRQCQDPIFILTCARTGSTLLRRIIDAHPAVYAPAETNIAQVFQTVYLAVASSFLWQDGDAWKPRAIEVCRLVAGEILDRAAADSGKIRWCDKSLPTIDYAEIVREVYPHARYICVYRSCRDFIASALEACPWGLTGFGFDPYAQDHPDNTVLALARYWADRTTRLLALEDQLAPYSHRIRYEDLVSQPEETIEQLCSALELEYSRDYFLPESLFQSKLCPGPEDAKFTFTQAITDTSVGRGAFLPIGRLLVPEILSRVVDLEHRLAYDATPHLQDASPTNGEDVAARAQAVADRVRTQLDSFGPARFRRLAPADRFLSFTIRVVHLGFQLVIPVDNGQVLSTSVVTSPVITVQDDVLDLLLSGRLSPTDAMRNALLSVERDGKACTPAEENTVIRIFLRALTYKHELPRERSDAAADLLLTKSSEAAV